MKPIIFNTEMVKAILDGRKTQTRRVFSKKQLKYFDYAQQLGEISNLDNFHKNDFSYILQFSKYKVDDILYVKETFQTCECGFCEICQVLNSIVFKADYNNKGEHPKLYSCYEDEIYWKPSIHLKQKDARIFLKVINARVEKIQDISMQDVLKEGVGMQGNPNRHLLDTKSDWVENWNSTAKDRYKWEDNPYIFVYEFERVKLGEVK